MDYDMSQQNVGLHWDYDTSDAFNGPFCSNDGRFKVDSNANIEAI